MKREWMYASLVLGLTMGSANALADAETGAGARPDAVLFQAHTGDVAATTLSRVAPSAACGAGRAAGAPDETSKVTWVDPARQVHGSGLIDNCAVTPEPDEREHARKLSSGAVRT